MRTLARHRTASIPTHGDRCAAWEIEAALAPLISGSLPVRLRPWDGSESGRYDAAASIEMGEHVGRANYPTYVEVLHDAVRPGRAGTDPVRMVTAWLKRFEASRDELSELVPEEVIRVWRLYLLGGRMAFEEGRMGVDQILAVRPGRAHDLPVVRSW